MTVTEIKNHGGSREGSGRPKGTGKYNSPTKTVRIPTSLEDDIAEFIVSDGNKIPFYTNLVQAGFPFPVEEERDVKRVSLYDTVLKNPEESFMVHATGESMRDAGIFDGDIMIVDRKMKAKSGAVVIASINGDFTVKRLSISKEGNYLLPENSEFNKIEISRNDNFNIIGVVTHVIHKV